MTDASNVLVCFLCGRPGEPTDVKRRCDGCGCRRKVFARFYSNDLAGKLAIAMATALDEGCIHMHIEEAARADVHFFDPAAATAEDVLAAADESLRNLGGAGPAEVQSYLTTILDHVQSDEAAKALSEGLIELVPDWIGKTDLLQVRIDRRKDEYFAAEELLVNSCVDDTDH